jgi:hypothetical protein
VVAFLMLYFKETTYYVLGLAFQVHLIPRPVQAQLYGSTQAEFVICEQSISMPHT